MRQERVIDASDFLLAGYGSDIVIELRRVLFDAPSTCLRLTT